jgi:hypothetical protein
LTERGKREGAMLSKYVVIVVFFVFPIGLAIALIAAIVWFMFDAKRQNRAMGIPPTQFSLRSLLIVTTMTAILLGYVVYLVKTFPKH